MDSDIDEKVQDTVVEVMSRELYDGPSFRRRFAKALTVLLFCMVVFILFVWWVASLRVEIAGGDVLFGEPRVFFINDCEIVGELGCKSHVVYQNGSVLTVKNVGVTTKNIVEVTVGECKLDVAVLLPPSMEESFVLPCGLEKRSSVVRLVVSNEETGLSRQLRGRARHIFELTWLHNGFTNLLGWSRGFVERFVNPYLVL